MINYQENHDSLTKIEKNLKTALSNVKKAITDNKDNAATAGLIFEYGKFIQDETGYLRVYYHKHYDRYVGEVGAKYSAEVDIDYITNAEYHELLESIISEDIEFLDEYGELEDDFLENFQKTDNGIKYIFVGDPHNQGAITSAGFLVKAMPKSEVLKIGIACNSWNFVDDMEFEFDSVWEKAEELLNLEI